MYFGEFMETTKRSKTHLGFILETGMFIIVLIATLR